MFRAHPLSYAMDNINNWISQQNQQVNHYKEKIQFHFTPRKHNLRGTINNIYAFTMLKVYVYSIILQFEKRVVNA